MQYHWHFADVQLKITIMPVKTPTRSRLKQRRRHAMPIFPAPAPTAQLESALAGQLLRTIEKADNSDVTALRDKYNLKHSDLERLTGFSIRALADWSAGKIPSQPARRRLHEIRRLLDSLARLVKIEAIPAWLRERNPSLDNMTPLQVIEVGEIDRLWQMVYSLGSDAAT